MVQERHGKLLRNTLKIMYTNVDGLISSLLELKDYLRTSKPDVVGIVETKLKEEIKVDFTKEGYNTWRRDRKGMGGGGVMLLVKEDIVVEEVEYGDGLAEIASVIIRTGGSEKRKIIVVYIPPKTNMWEINTYKNMHNETRATLEGMIRKNYKVLLVGDFNSKEINWEKLEIQENEGP